MRILGTGTHFDEYPGALDLVAARDRHDWSRLSTDQREELARARAGELLFVRMTAFVEFDRGQGAERWEGTPQGPWPVPLGRSATSALLRLVEDDLGGLEADLGISGLHVARFDYHAAPRRIDVAPELARRLVLD